MISFLHRNGSGRRGRTLRTIITAQKPRIGPRPGPSSSSLDLLRLGVHDGGSRRPPGGDTCFLNIVGRHRPPCLTSGSQEGSISHNGNGPWVPDQPNGARRKPLVRATIRIGAPSGRQGKTCLPWPGQSTRKLRAFEAEVLSAVLQRAVYVRLW